MAFIICKICQKSHQSKHSLVCRRCRVDEAIIVVIEPQRTHAKPTEHMPGSEGKIRVMTARIKKNQYIHHALDGIISSKMPRGAHEPKAAHHLTLDEDDSREDYL